MRSRGLTTSPSPYARLHLFRNPFGELSVAERARLAVVDIETHLEWLDHASSAALQVIGPCGHGKSTHLRAIQYAWAARAGAEALPAFVYFPEEGDQPALPRSRPLFIDEAQRMNWWRRRQMLSGNGPLVIGTHCDLSRALQAAGFQLRTIDLDQPMPPERIKEILNRRIESSRVHPTEELDDDHVASPGFLSGLTLADVVALQDRFGSNIRQMEEHLYIRFQRFALKGEPWLPVDW